MQNLDNAIRERAYHLWIAAGRTHGHADVYWLAAQREILASSIVSGAVFKPAQHVKPAISDVKHPAKKAKAVAARKSKRRAA